jgi:L-fuconolactonase
LRIDSHQHFTAAYSPELLFPILKRNRFDATVLVGEPVERDFVLALVAPLDLASPESPHALDALQRNPKFRGVYYGFEHDALPANLAELERRGLSLDLPPRPELAQAIGERFPALRMALDHVGRPSLTSRPFEEWARALEIAARHLPLCVKISGLITDAPAAWQASEFRPAVQHALRTFGPGRVMYGSDWPSYLPEGTWKEALAAFTQAIGAQPIEVREQLLGGTAARFYRIPAGAAA